MTHDPTRMNCFLPQSGLPIKLEGKDLRCIVVRGQVTVRESPAYYDIANGLTGVRGPQAEMKKKRIERAGQVRLLLVGF